MGLRERRAMQEIKSNQFPLFKEKIESLTGKQFEWDVQWDLLSTEGQTKYYNQGIERVFFLPIYECFQSICADDMGKEALAENLDKIVWTNKSENSRSGKMYQFENKVLKVDHKTHVNLPQLNEKRDRLLKLLEDNL